MILAIAKPRWATPSNRSSHGLNFDLAQKQNLVQLRIILSFATEFWKIFNQIDTHMTNFLAKGLTVTWLLEGNVRDFVSWISNIWATFESSNGMVAVNMIYSTQPNDQISYIFGLYACPWKATTKKLCKFSSSIKES